MTTLDRFLSGSSRTEQKNQSAPDPIEKTASPHPSFIKIALDKYAMEIRDLNSKVLLLEKSAEVQDKATKIACQMLKEGRIGVNEVLEKIAELRTKNLDIVEEAIKLGYSNSNKITSLGGADTEDMPYNTTDPITRCLLGQ